MSNSPPSPNWSLLPRDAEAFFGLEEGFDRKSLKRSYNALIRVYKPEKFPEEFQKIRAAYEQLDSQLRYGRRVTQSLQSTAEASQWDDAGGVTPNPNAADSGSAADKAGKLREQTVREKLKTQNPADVYKWLKAVENKGPYEYFALAALSDVIKNEPTLYLKWLLTGLKFHSHDPGLMQLLKDFMLREHSDESLISMLVTTSQVISSDRYYYLTEKVWLNLLERLTFAKFKIVLERCEANLNIHRNEAQMVFYCELMKGCVLIADQKWLEQKFHLLQSASTDQFRGLHFDLDLLDTLKAYRQDYQTHQDCSVCQRIHSAIKSYFMLDERQGDAAVIECQTYFADNAQSLLDAFPWGEENYSSMLMLWAYINYDVTERHEFSVGANVAKLKARNKFLMAVKKLLYDLDGAESFDFGYLLRYAGYKIGPIALVIFLSFQLVWLASLLVTIPLQVGVSLFLAGWLILIYYFYVSPKWVAPRFLKMVRTAVLKDYRRWWRGRFVQLFDATHATMEQLVSGLSHVVSDNENFSGGISWTPQLVNDDIGLILYSMAVPYRR